MKTSFTVKKGSVSGIKGSSMELSAAAYFQSHGFVVRRDVSLSVAAGTADVTDIDMLGINYVLPLGEIRVVADCKDRKKSRPFERILWTSGLAVFCKANRSIVILPQAPWQAREFASQGGVEILDVENMEAYLQSLGKNYVPFGDADPNMSLRVNYIRRSLSEKQRDILREDTKLRQMLVIGHPITNLNRIIRMLSKLQQKVSGEHEDIAWMRRYVSLNAGIAASIMLVRFAVESKWTPRADWEDYARKKLTYGDVPPRKAQELAKLALERDYYEGLPAPKYSEELIGVLGSLISNPVTAASVPYFLDYYLLGIVFSRINKKYIPTHLSTGYEETYRMAKKILSALSYSADITVDIWGEDKKDHIKIVDLENSQEELPLNKN